MKHVINGCIVDASVRCFYFLLLLFSDTVCKSLLLMQGLVIIFSKVTVLSGNNIIEKEWGGKNVTARIPLFLRLFE